MTKYDGVVVCQLFLRELTWVMLGNITRVLYFSWFFILRYYISVDVLRRVMINHFGYDIAYYININDINNPRSNMYGRKRPDPTHFLEHSGEMAGNHRKLRGKWKQYSRRKLTGIFRSFSRLIQPETRWKAAGKNPTISKQETCPQKKLDTTVSGRKTDSCSAPFSPVISLAFR